MIILALLLGACGGADEPSPTPEPTPTIEPTPTPEPIPGRLAVNEIMPVAPEGGAPWVELRNVGELPVASAGVVVTDMDDSVYTIPEASPMIQPGDLVLITFDGQGSDMDDYDAGDGLVALHTPEEFTAPFDPEGDQVGVYSSKVFHPETVIDFVAWSRPPVENDNPAVAAGIWLDGVFINAERGGEITGESQPGESMGIFPGQPVGFRSSWVVYASGETTPGMSNGIPTSAVLMPGPGAILFRDDYYFTWYDVPHADHYILQVDDNAEFDSPEIDVMVDETIYEPESPLDEGEYYWRLKAVDESGNEGSFTEGSEVIVVDIPQPDLDSLTVVMLDSESSGSTLVSLPATFSSALMSTGAGLSSLVEDPEISTVNEGIRLIPPQAGDWTGTYVGSLHTLLQQKDSDMLCWDGDDELGARKPWDNIHQDLPGIHSPHGRNYCARASIAMINNYYSGDLTQDRITYEQFKGISPYLELGHDVPLSIANGARLLSWAVQRPVTLTMGKPTFAQIQGWINSGRGVMAGIPRHAIVLRGWAIFQGENPRIPAGTQFVLYNDPWVDRIVWQRYASIELTNTRVPTGNPTGRMMEETLDQDPDEDGINSFDEMVRFRTNPNYDDTDFDCVPDKADMAGILYEPANVYLPRPADFDWDGSYKYLDPDNDNGDIIDGDEDFNFNGHLDEDETDNFNFLDDDPMFDACTKPFLVFIDYLTGGITHSTSFSYILADVVVLGNDPVPMPNATVTLRMDGAGSSETIEVTTGEDGSAQGEFKIFSYGTYTLTVENIEGENMVYTPSMNQVSSITVQVGPAEVPLPTTREETIQAFAAKLSEAFRTENWGFALERVHPVVIDLYGQPLCATYLRDQADPSFNINVTASTGPEAWNWERDERITSLENVYEVSAYITAREQTTFSTLHFVQVEDGTFRWLTDCGVPAP
jgi:hypothetical protein